MMMMMMMIEDVEIANRDSVCLHVAEIKSFIHSASYKTQERNTCSDHSFID